MVGVGLALWSSNLAGKPIFIAVKKPVAKFQHSFKVFRFFLKKWQYKAALFWLCASPIAVANRTGLLATSGAVSTFLLYRSKLRALPVIITIFCLGIFTILYVPSFRDSTFYDPKDATIENLAEIDETEFDSSGRFEMWKYLMKRLYYPNPVIGSGLGATQRFMYTARGSLRGSFGKLKVPHSEYVVLLCDLGLIGFSLYLLTAISAIYAAIQSLLKKNMMEKFIGGIVASSFVALFCAMGFDNAHLYALGVHQYPFAFLGMLLAVQSKSKITVSTSPGYSFAQ